METDCAVLELVNQLPKGYSWNLAVDNYFTYPRLFWELRQRGVGGVGTVRPNRV